jgi:hypothetical protein
MSSLLGVSHEVSTPITSSPSRDVLVHRRSELENASKSRITDRIPFAKKDRSAKVFNDNLSMKVTVTSKATEVSTFAPSTRRTLDEWKYIQIGINLARSEDLFVLEW